MKNYILPLLFSLVSFAAFSQKGISYQAVILDPNPIEAPGVDIAGQPLVNGDVWMKFSIYNGSALQFEEIHKTKTDAYGLVSLLIGSVSPTAFNSVVWDANQKIMQVFASFDQGASYTKVSEQKLVYTPYALFSETAGKLGGTLAITGGGTGATSLADARVNLGIDKVDNTPDAVKPISAAVQAALDLKANSAEVTAALTLKANAADVTAALAAKADTVAIKTYVDNRLASGNFTATQSSTAATITDADASTKGKIQLAGDLGGTADAPTVPGLALKANEADVTTALALKANTTDVTTALAIKANAVDFTTLTNRINTNTQNITSNASDIATLNTHVASNTTSITANATAIATEAATARAAELSLTNNISSNTSSITANTTAIATEAATARAAELALTNNISSNTSSITANTTAIATEAATARAAELALTNTVTSNTTSIGNLNSNIALNTASITTNTSAITSNTTSITANATAIATEAATARAAELALTNTISLNTINTTSNTNAITINTASILTNSSDILLRATNTSPALTGIPTAPTALLGTNTTQLATTAFVNSATSNINASSISGTIAVSNGGTGATTLTGIVKGNGTSALTAAIAGTDYQAPITLTTSGTGSATLSGTTLNIPLVSSTVSTSTLSGTVALANGGTGQTTIAGIQTALGLAGSKVAIGADAGKTSQGSGALAFGNGAGQTNQGAFSVALGYVAGSSNQGASSIAIGVNAAQYTQGANSIAIGDVAGQISQGAYSVAIGSNSQSALNAVAIGGYSTSSFANSIAIGYKAATTAANTIQLGGDGVVTGSTAITNVKTTGTLTAGTVTYPNAHNSTAGQLLSINATGTAAWTTPVSSGSTHAIGEVYGGGIVFYIWDGGAHGLIGANTELNSGQAISWGGGSGTYVGTTSFYGVLGGKLNTQRILNVIPVPTYGNGDPQTGQRSAAYWAAIYLNAPVVVSGVTITPQFSDWYLPNAYELTLFATQSSYFPNCNFATHDHWSSSERSDYAYLAYALGANSNTNTYQDNKSSTKHVVAIRSF